MHSNGTQSAADTDARCVHTLRFDQDVCSEIQLISFLSEVLISDVSKLCLTKLVTSLTPR